MLNPRVILFPKPSIFLKLPLLAKAFFIKNSGELVASIIPAVADVLIKLRLLLSKTLSFLPLSFN
jgi:hypothetical protein